MRFRRLPREQHFGTDEAADQQLYTAAKDENPEAQATVAAALAEFRTSFAPQTAAAARLDVLIRAAAPDIVKAPESAECFWLRTRRPLVGALQRGALTYRGFRAALEGREPADQADLARRGTRSEQVFRDRLPPRWSAEARQLVVDAERGLGGAETALNERLDGIRALLLRVRPYEVRLTGLLAAAGHVEGAPARRSWRAAVATRTSTGSLSQGLWFRHLPLLRRWLKSAPLPFGGLQAFVRLSLQSDLTAIHRRASREAFLESLSEHEQAVFKAADCGDDGPPWGLLVLATRRFLAARKPAESEAFERRLAGESRARIAAAHGKTPRTVGNWLTTAADAAVRTVGVALRRPERRAAPPRPQRRRAEAADTADDQVLWEEIIDSLRVADRPQPQSGDAGPQQLS